jgi:tetratricopeptide (TPR) repeat protein
VPRFIEASRFFAAASLAAAVAFAAPARAQDPFAEQARLADHIRQRPTDYDATYRYVLLSTELRDYEAAIGALERLLMFNPNLARAQKELGFLYARLGAHQTAAQHLRAALAAPGLDPIHKSLIEAQLPEIEKQTQPSRWYGRFQTGLRSQSNANYFPASGLFQLGGVGVGAIGASRQSDVNAFELVQIGHDYDFQNQRGDILETRASAYLTQQFRLDRYNVALFSGSFGPRFALAPELFPGVTIKPYVTGTVSALGHVNYLNAGGVGVSLRAPIGERLTIEPGFEWRALHVNSHGGNPFNFFSTLSTLATGDALTGSISAVLRATDDISLDGRVAYTRANAFTSSQSSNQLDARAMLRLEVDPPLQSIPRRWTIAPYARFVALNFDAPNPLVDPWRARRDAAWTYGVALEAPVTAWFGFSGHLEFARNDSNLSNFRTQNVSVAFGPVAKF